MSDEKSAGELRVERAKRMAIEGAEAWAEHETEQKAVEARTTRLRALRLEKELADSVEAEKVAAEAKLAAKAKVAGKAKSPAKAKADAGKGKVAAKAKPAASAKGTSAT